MFIKESDVADALDWLNQNAIPAAKARAERQYCEEYLRVVKATLMQEHHNLSGIAQEREAYADPRYLQQLDAIREAVERDERNRFLRSTKETLIEAWRSQCANERTRI